MIVIQFKSIVFISCIQEKYEISASLNSVFNTFRDLSFYDLKLIDKQVYYQLIYVCCTIKNWIECKMERQNWKQSNCPNQ